MNQPGQMPLSLPTISLPAALNGVDKKERQHATHQLAEQILLACEQSGFFYVSDHGISATVINAVHHSQRALFAQSDEYKQSLAINLHNRGYLADGQARMHGAKHADQKEVFFWGRDYDSQHPFIQNNVPLCGVNQWPNQSPSQSPNQSPNHSTHNSHTVDGNFDGVLDNFKQHVLDYAAEIERIGTTLLSGFAVALGADAHFFDDYYRDSMLRGQLIRYPVTRGDDDSFGVAPHTDFGCITLLLQETAGLEVLCRDQWIQVPPIDGTLVINIGDLLQRWSNNRLPSTRHRVRNTNPEARYSIAMFYDPAPDAVVDPTHIDSTPGHSQFEPVTAAEYILSRNKGAFKHYNN